MTRPTILTMLTALAGSPALGQTMTVNTLEDRVDFAAPQTAAQLPGPDGVVSFREACIAANNTPGAQTIAFAIPQSEWGWMASDRATLKQEGGTFLLSDDATTVDFTTQEAFTGNTNPNGNEVAVYGLVPNAMGVASIVVYGNHCVIKGLDRVQMRGHGVELRGNNNRVIGCTISGPLYSGVFISGGFGGPPATGNIVGGTAPGEGNRLSAGNHGVRIDTPAEGNIVIGNTLSGTYAGVAVRGNPYTGSPVNNRIGGPAPGERNLIAGAGRYGEEGFPDGAQVSVERAVGTLIEGNYIGTTPDGLGAAVQRGPAGVEVRDSTGTVIRGNVIGGIRVVGTNHYAGQLFGDGVRITAFNAPTTGTVLEGNLIGVGADGQTPVPNLYGVRAAPATANQAITATRVEGNTIAFNERAGVLVTSLVSGVRITGTLFRDNGQLGIDLTPSSGAMGVTPNDPADGDAGGNGLQNFPVIEAATSTPQGMHVSGTLNSQPNHAYALEFFAGPGCDPSGHGEGAQFLGSLEVTTDAAGNAAFAGTVPGSAPAGSAVTATAAQLSTGNTSEFSACIGAGGGGASLCYANCDGSAAAPVLNVADFSCFLTRFAAGEAWANCDQSTAPPVLNVADFSCFLQAYAAGCP